MNNSTVWIVVGAVVLYYLYTKQKASAYAYQAQVAAQNQTSNYIQSGINLANELF